MRTREFRLAMVAAALAAMMSADARIFSSDQPQGTIWSLAEPGPEDACLTQDANSEVEAWGDCRLNGLTMAAPDMFTAVAFGDRGKFTTVGPADTIRLSLLKAGDQRPESMPPTSLTAGQEPVSYSIGGSTGTPGIRKLMNSVPDLATVLAGALLLLPFGTSTLAILRKSGPARKRTG